MVQYLTYSDNAAKRLPLDNLVSMIQLQGGFSYSLAKGKFAPNVGYMASIQGYELKADYTGLRPKNRCYIGKCIRDYVNEHREELSGSRVYLGAWIDNGTLYLDISVHMANIRAAKTFARRNNQQAIFDLKNQVSIYVYPISN